MQVVSPDEIVHVPKLFHPLLDRLGEPFANLATRTGLNDLRVEHRRRSLAGERKAPDGTIL